MNGHDYPRYARYKDSGSEWLGEIPSHWETRRLKYLCRCNPEALPEDTDSERVLQYVDIGNVDAVKGIVSSEAHTFANSPSRARRMVRDGDVIISTVRTYLKAIARIEQPPANMIVSTGFAVLRPATEIDSRFMGYALHATHFLESVVAHSVGVSYPGINASVLIGFRVVLPSLPEQSTIAAFLDRETAKIDVLIEKQERLIERLEEKRKALISRAVTKGLNPNVKMKDSGVQWLGRTPEHWDIKQIRRETSVKRGASPRPIDDPIYFDDDGKYSWVRISDVTAAGMYLIKSEQKLSELGASLSVKLTPGDLFLSIAGSVGKPCIAGIPCCIHDGFVYFPQLKCEQRFLYYIFASGEAYKGLGKYGTQLNLNTDTVGSMHLPFPPREEQIKISNHLDKTTRQMDEILFKAKQLIDKLRERRTALISAAVTGKIKVGGG